MNGKFNDIKIPPFVLSCVEGLRERFGIVLESRSNESTVRST